MCGRFNVIEDPALQALLRELGVEAPIGRRINVAPTEPVAVVVDEDGRRDMRDMRWWLVPSWAPAVSTQYSMFNARAENLHRSRAFRGPLQRRRGIVPASSFIEWQKVEGRKQPWLIRPSEGALALAALWDCWERGGERIESCTIVTVDAVEAFRPWHARMPLMLPLADARAWLDHQLSADAVQALLQPALPAQLTLEPLDPAINNSRNKDEGLLCATGPAQRLG